MKKGIYLLARSIMFCFGCYFPNLKRVNVDYRKWLGPDWKPDFEGPPSTIITPHTGWTDIFCHMLR